MMDNDAVSGLEAYQILPGVLNCIGPFEQQDHAESRREFYLPREESGPG
jgi:hypothetical protein